MTDQAPRSHKTSHHNSGNSSSHLTLDQFLAGLRQTEHGVYDWQDNGAGAYGAYQFTLPLWEANAKAIGINPNDHSQQAQDAVARHAVQQYYKQYGDWSKVAAAWFGGPGNVTAYFQNGEDRSDGNVSTSEYIQRVLTDAGGDPAYVTQSVQSGGGAGNGVPGGDAGNAQLSKQDVSAALDSLGFPKALIESDPTLHQAFNQILTEQIDLSTSTGQDRAEQILKSTDWWKTRSKTQRDFDARMADPAERKSLLSDIHQKRADLKVIASQMGVTLNKDQLDHLAQLSLRNGLDDAQLNRALAGHFQYDPNKPMQGTVAADVQGLQSLAAQYYVNLGPAKIQQLVQRLLNGELKPTDLTDYFKQQALSRFPHLEQQFNKGFTVADVAEPYIQAYQNILGVNPTDISNHDPLLMQALQQPDGKGGFQLMPEWQFEQQLRKDPRWLNTPDAKTSVMNTGVQILKDWGLA